MGHLDGQAAVVTGTAQGIGREIADLLEAEGAIVHRVDKDSVDLRGRPVVITEQASDDPPTGRHVPKSAGSHVRRKSGEILEGLPFSRVIEIDHLEGRFEE